MHTDATGWLSAVSPRTRKVLAREQLSLAMPAAHVNRPAAHLVASLDKISLLSRRVVYDRRVLSGKFDRVPQSLFLTGTG